VPGEPPVLVPPVPRRPPVPGEFPPVPVVPPVCVEPPLPVEPPLLPPVLVEPPLPEPLSPPVPVSPPMVWAQERPITEIVASVSNRLIIMLAPWGGTGGKRSVSPTGGERAQITVQWKWEARAGTFAVDSRVSHFGSRRQK
jgi:hypothetical protein